MVQWQDSDTFHFDGLLRPGDLLVMNDTRVIKARLFGEKASGGAVQAWACSSKVSVLCWLGRWKREPSLLRSPHAAASG